MASRVVEVTLFREQGQVQDIEGTIKLTDTIITKVADESVKDALRGTYVWKHERLSCPDTISQIYRGPLKFYVNSSDTNLEGGLAVLEREDQIAGLEITTSFSLCFTAAWLTHIRDVVIVLHNDNFHDSGEERLQSWISIRGHQPRIPAQLSSHQERTQPKRNAPSSSPCNLRK